MKSLIITFLVASTTVTGLALPVRAQLVTEDEALMVANNWITLMIQKRGDWGGSETAVVDRIQPFTKNGRTIGYFCNVQPQGHIIISLRRELIPVKAFSDTSNLNPDSDEGLPGLLKGCMERIVKQIEEQVGPIATAKAEALDKIIEKNHLNSWAELEQGSQVLQEDSDSWAIAMNYVEGLVLLSDSWHQGPPYNERCPTGDTSCPSCKPGDPTLPTNVGCVATAAAQIMRYWAWPPYGVGSKCYDWDGDDSCPEGGNPGAGAKTICADFEDPYNWLYMANRYDWDSIDNRWEDENGNPLTQDHIDAVSTLCLDIGVGVEMDWGVCGSGAPTEDMEGVYENYYLYSYSCCRLDRVDYTTEGWFNEIKIQLNNNQPIQYSIIKHAIVADGWLELGTTPSQYYHMNYGWGKEGDCWEGCNTWYGLDGLYLGNPEYEYMMVNIFPVTALRHAIEGTYTKEVFNYRYFNQDATADNGAIFRPGQNLQFLPGVKVTCTSPRGILFEGGIDDTTRLFSIKETKLAGIRIYNGGIALFQNGSITFHDHLGQ
jgi:hypothetical protein